MLKNERESNWELLRILSMLAIVSGHFIGQIPYDISTGNILVAYIRFGLRIAVNIFLMMGCWFMVDSSFNYVRIIKLYLQMWFYSVSITLILYLCGYDISIKEIITSFIPFITLHLWFVPTYIALMLLAPYLKKFFTLDLLKQKYGLVIMLFLFSVMGMLHPGKDNFQSDLLWFCYIFLLVGYYKNNLYNKV